MISGTTWGNWHLRLLVQVVKTFSGLPSINFGGTTKSADHLWLACRVNSLK
jgi:hypothetical protein